MTRGQILSERIRLIALRSRDQEATELTAILDDHLKRGVAQSSMTVQGRQRRRLEGLRTLLAERMKLEAAHPMAPEDADTWHPDLHVSIDGIIDEEARRIHEGLETDLRLYLGHSGPSSYGEQAAREISELRGEYHHEADILKGEREHAAKIPAPLPPITLNISNSQIAGLNVAGTVGSIQATVNALQTEGSEKLAAALKALAEAIARADRLPDDAKRESLELVSAMGDELTGHRRQVILRSIGATSKGLVVHTGEAYGAYEAVKLAVKLLVGYDLP